MNTFSLYWHTLKYLKPIQFWYRLWFRIYKPKPARRPIPPLRKRQAAWINCSRSRSMFGVTIFKFLNQQQTLSFPQDWNNPRTPTLWRYNLHYFDDLVSDDSDSRVEWHAGLISSWIKDNPPCDGVGWDSYPTSLRVVNWIKWCLAGNAAKDNLVESLGQQVRWLNTRIEYHLQANHLWTNAKALLFAGVFFDGDESNKWLKKGEKLLEQQLAIQILSDGGHFERSPMYHAIVLEDILDLLQLSALFPGIISRQLVDTCKSKVPVMFFWMRTMSHPDDNISFFNDATMNIAPRLESLIMYAQEQGITEPDNAHLAMIKLPDSGYIKIQNQNMVVIADVGKLGPDFQPGHAHADTLSFEASLFEKRFIVNSGIDRYGIDDERFRQRSTIAHSTVEVDGANSSEVWGGFRVARRANPVDLLINDKKGLLSISCSHDGYQRLSGNVIHNRSWLLKDHALELTDKLSGKYDVAIAQYYLHPDVELIEISQSSGKLRHCDRIVLFKIEGGEVKIEESTYHPEFGVSLKNNCLGVRFKEAICTVRFLWDV